MVHLRQSAFIVLCCVALYFSGLTSRPLIKSSEGRVGQVAQEFIESGDWIVPHLNGEIRKEKPPLSSWLVALVTKASGAPRVQAWHASLIPAIASILVVLLVFSWVAANEAEPPAQNGTQGFLNRAPTGMLAALMLATSVGFMAQTRSAELDMLMALWVTLALIGYFNYRKGLSPRWLLLTYAALALSVLTKGHVGIIIVVPTIGVWHFYERSFHTLALPERGAWHWHLAGLLLASAIVLPWGIPFIQQSGITWQDFHKEGLDRFDARARHAQPAWWYLEQFPTWFLPWSILFPVALWQTRNDPPDERSPLRRLCWVWLLLCLVLFSVIKAKQRHYAVPFFPPMAILIADSVIRLLQSENPQWGRRLLAMIAALLALSTVVVAALAKDYGLLFGNGPAVIALSVLSCITLFGAAWMAARQGYCFTLFWAGAVCVVSIIVLTGERAESTNKTFEPFCIEIRTRIPQTVKLYDYDVLFVKNVWKADILFYLQRKVYHKARPLTEFLDDPNETGYALVSDKSLVGIPSSHYEIVVTDIQRLGHGRPVYMIRRPIAAANR